MNRKNLFTAVCIISLLVFPLAAAAKMSILSDDQLCEVVGGSAQCNSAWEPVPLDPVDTPDAGAGGAGGGGGGPLTDAGFPVGAPDSGAGGDSTGGGGDDKAAAGCNCRVQGGGRNGWAPLLFLAALGLRVRRRR